jgi:hypothetical protein
MWTRMFLTAFTRAPPPVPILSHINPAHVLQMAVWRIKGRNIWITEGRKLQIGKSNNKNYPMEKKKGRMWIGVKRKLRVEDWEKLRKWITRSRKGSSRRKVQEIGMSAKEENYEEKKHVCDKEKVRRRKRKQSWRIICRHRGKFARLLEQEFAE